MPTIGPRCRSRFLTIQAKAIKYSLIGRTLLSSLGYAFGFLVLSKFGCHLSANKTFFQEQHWSSFSGSILFFPVEP